MPGPILGFMITPGESILLVAAIAQAVVTIIKAIADGWGRAAVKADVERARVDLADKSARIADVTNGKLDQIHELTNSNLTALKAQLAAALARIDHLETLLSHQA